jgi:hypothetical protein
VMSSENRCVLDPIENCKTQTGKNFTDCTECVDGVTFDSAALSAGANPCACGNNMEYRDMNEFGTAMAPGCYCPIGRTGANCDETFCPDIFDYNSCDFCYESYPDQCLRCKDHVVVTNQSTFDFD